MDYVLKLRTAAIQCSKVEVRRALHAVASRLDRAIQDFARAPTENNLISLNGAWAAAARVAKTVPPEGTPAPLGGSPDAPLLSEGTDVQERRAA
jgi:hypothetical protein